jgi:phage tail-like protein
MTVVEEHAYDFRTAAQWSAGVRDNLRADGDSLAVPPRLEAEPMPDTGRADGGALLAADPRGRLWWLRPHTRELAALGELGVSEQGVLAGQGSPRALVAGRTVLWVLAHGRLDRYLRSTRQRLTPSRPDPGWSIVDATGDGTDGVWLVEGDGQGHWRLRHVDCWGHSTREPIAVDAASEPAIASTSDGARLAILDRHANAVTVRETTGDRTPITFALDPVFRGRPLLRAVDTRLHLLGNGQYQAVNLADGGVEDHQEIALPVGRGKPVGLAATGAGLVVSATAGLVRIVPRDDSSRARRSTFITPALVSPIGVRSGWNRAEIDLLLPVGTAIEVAWAATVDPALIARAAELLAGPATAGRAEALEQLLPWRDDEAVTYKGAGDDQDHLAVLLSDRTETTLWLRLRVVTPSGRTPPRVDRLRVRYPDTSLVDELPAVYRSQPRSAAELRRILAPYEVLLDELDETLSGLPARVDPATTTPGWTAALLSWLGFPPLDDLAADRRQALLAAVADILDRRGTRDGLERVLSAVTGGQATVIDAATGPAGWFLGTPGGSLGHGTVALAQLPAPARPGAMVLGDTPLGAGCPDPGRMIAERAGVITVDLERDATVAPFVDRLLPYFVPAHCRVRVRYGRRHTPQIDVDLRLDASPTGGDAPSRLGRWSLPRPESRPAVLDDTPELRAGPRLQ